MKTNIKYLIIIIIALFHINVLSQVTPGDVKQGIQDADHGGWYLMDGRALNTLSSTAQANAVSVGINSNLPDMTDRFIKNKTSSESIGQFGGNNGMTITQSNMPNYSVNGATSTEGNHSHTWEDYWPNNIFVQGGDQWLTIVETAQRSVPPAGNHSHTVTAATGGTGVPVPAVPEYVAVNTFIYLGE